MNDKCWHTSSEDLLSTLSGKWVLFDTSAIHRLIENEADDFWKALAKHSITPCYLDLIVLELLAHRDATERTRRLEIIGNLSPLSLQPTDSEAARRLQNELHAVTSKDCTPSPTDLYIGAVAARFPDNLLIATENVTDFPKPHFERVGFILLEDKLRVKIVSLLRVTDDTRSRIKVNASRKP